MGGSYSANARMEDSRLDMVAHYEQEGTDKMLSLLSSEGKYTFNITQIFFTLLMLYKLMNFRFMLKWKSYHQFTVCVLGGGVGVQVF